jgi:hypothetical protein
MEKNEINKIIPGNFEGLVYSSGQDDEDEARDRIGRG